MTGAGPSSPLVVVDAELEGRPGQAVRVERGRIVAVGPDAAVDRRGAEVIDAAGGALLPGLHDHHLHLLALAARLTSVDLAEATDGSEADALVAVAARVRPVAGPDGWVRVVGYDEHRHGPLDRDRLDALGGPAAVRVQHRSGLAWVVSTAGLGALGLDPGPGPDAATGDPPPDRTSAGGDEPSGRAGTRSGRAVEVGEAVERTADGRATGWLHRLDRWLGDRVGRAAPDLGAAGRHLAALGITGVTDATVALDAGAERLLTEARASGALPQHLLVLGRPGPFDPGGDPGTGPWKLVADEHAGLDVDALAAEIATSHARGRPVAIHCVTAAECVAAVVALEAAGPRAGDRLEHASTMPPALDASLARHRVTVVGQPAWVHERGDHYLEAVEPADRPALHRLASLVAAGVPLAAGSDAPMGTADPWAAVAAAVGRRTASGAVLGPAEALAPLEALGLFLGPLDDPGGPRRRLGTGAPADLCLLREPLRAVAAAPVADAVRATVVAGRVVHRADG